MDDTPIGLKYKVRSKSNYTYKIKPKVLITKKMINDYKKDKDKFIDKIYKSSLSIEELNHLVGQLDHLLAV